MSPDRPAPVRFFVELDEAIVRTVYARLYSQFLPIAQRAAVHSVAGKEALPKLRATVRDYFHRYPHRRHVP